MQIKSNLISELSQGKIDQTQKSNPETNDQTYRLRRCDPKMQDTNFGEKRTNQEKPKTNDQIHKEKT